MPENDFQLKLAADLSQMERGLAKITNQLSSVVGGLQQVDGATKKTEQSATAAGKAQGQFSTSLNSTRYALYDVSRTMTIAGAALLGLAILPSKVAISFEREFANVSRTVAGAGSDVKQALIDLSTELPTSFKNLAEIATLGGQLGIAKEGIVSFTSVIAKLTATTNLTAEVAGTALGRFLSFGLVTTKEFGNLASAILKVGVNSVATESQIVGIATGIAGIGKVAGLSAATLVGYAGSLASVGIQQYAARGTTQRLLSQIQKAASEGGPALDIFAKIAGTSAQSIQTSFGTAKFSPIFESLIKNLGDTSLTGQDLNTTLSDLGINSVIDRRSLLQLAAAPATVAQAFRDANSGIKDSSTLNEQYGKIAQTTAAKITIFGNSIQSLLNSIGSATTGPLGGVLEFLNQLTKSLTDLVSTPFGQGVAIIGTAFLALSGIFLLVGGAATRTIASFIGMITAMKGLQAESGGAGISMGALNAELALTGPAGARAAAGLRLVGVAAKTIGVVGIGVGFVAGASVAAGALDGLLDKARGWSNDIESVIKRVTEKGYGKNLYDGIFGGSGSTLQSSSKLDDFTRGLDRFFANANFGTAGARQIKILDDQLTELATSGNLDAIKQGFQELTTRTGLSTGELLKNFPALREAMTDAGISIRGTGDSLVVYAKKTDDAKKATDEAAASLGTTTDFYTALTNATGLDEKGIASWTQSYQKSVSSLTDFNSVVGQVQAALTAQADARSAATKAEDSSKDFYDGQSVSLAQFTTQLQVNNQAQAVWAQNLVQISTQYGPEAAQPFIDAGYSAVNASILQQLVDASPEQAQAYIDAQIQAAQLASQATATALLASGFLVTDTGAQIGKETAQKLAQGITLGLPVESLMASLNVRLAGSPLTPQANTGPARAAIDSFVISQSGRKIYIDVVGNPIGIAGRATGSIPRAAGGIVRGPGTGTSDSINARLSDGEYVIKASRVRSLGVNFFDQLNQGRSSSPGHYAGGGPVSGNGITSGIMELGPNSLNAVRGSGGDIVIQIDGREVARVVTNANNGLNKIGSN